DRYICKAKISIKGFEAFALLKDISNNGFCMASKTYITIEPKETVTIQITPESVTGIASFSLNVEVRWVRSTPTLFTVGFLIKETGENKQFQQYIAYAKQNHSVHSAPKAAFQ
ncbi:MAG: PilZ domain-containing protein, partial [Treponema sp.]|nr:PilZ domain-containing protein [Treponema sp.]